MSSSVTIRTLSSNRFFCDILRHTHCYVPRPMSSSSSSAMKIVNARLDDELEEIRSAGTWKTERVITSKQDINIRVDGCTGPILNFCANNYLGLSCHPQVVSSGKMAMDSHGAGLSSVRFICGTQNIHKELEDKISRFHGQDAVLSDSLNHASIIDGIRLCKAKKYRYAHKDMKDLESKLRESKDARSRLIVTDGVFSMDGNVAPLPDIVELADKYKALIFMDECHATEGKVDIINSTLGKALGGASGGYTTASKQLWATLHDFRSKMTQAGFTLSGDDHPICPVMIGDAKLASDFADLMLEKGIYVIGFSFPVVPKGKARIRVQISAAHTTDDIDKTVDAFISIGKHLQVIS
ncbi:kbl [Lepeophtheirus salmonis]|uniref:Kbl n=1 Tax=Lepeophtheirus salmonis TaxID=72036 RepID=A0A7R8D3Y3_LEPSM|nr:kbl [Lepeophtheirus salmonis]CAF3021378.1 kbl [Lepeophtheirus salmonis]